MGIFFLLVCLFDQIIFDKFQMLPNLLFGNLIGLFIKGIQNIELGIHPHDYAKRVGSRRLPFLINLLFDNLA